MSTHGLQAQTTEWWVAKLSGAVQEAADVAVKHGSETVRLLDRTRVKCEYVDQARQSARLTSEVAVSSRTAFTPTFMAVTLGESRHSQRYTAESLPDQALVTNKNCHLRQSRY